MPKTVIMRRIIVLGIVSIWITGCSQKYFIVRHGEKEQVSTGTTMQTPDDPPLTSAGTARAAALAQRLHKEKIRHIYSTNTIRTRSTAQPAAVEFKLDLVIYKSADSSFIEMLKGLRKNVLVVGHSNTVDELVNGLFGRQQISDLPDTAYDNLFILTRRGSKWKFRQEKYGLPSPQ